MDIRSVSRRFGAVALVIGPLAVVAGSLFEVSGDDDSVATSLTKIARHQGEQRVLSAVDLIAAFMLPAMLYLTRPSRRGEHPRIARQGGTESLK
jgi:H+/gluconate symporter-like permease